MTWLRMHLLMEDTLLQATKRSLSTLLLILIYAAVCLLFSAPDRSFLSLHLAMMKLIY